MDALKASDLVLLGILVLAVILDFRSMKISNRLIFVGIVLALAIQIWGNGLLNVFYVLGNISFPVILLYLFYLIGAIGAGDVKLFSVIGGFFNFKELVLCIAASFVLGALFSLGKMLYYGSFFSGLHRGMVHIRDLVRGEHVVCERDYACRTNLIHFSLAILFGAVFAKAYFILL